MYCCHACNAFKGDYWQPDTARRLLHPLRDSLVEHIAERANGTLSALTETGAFHIQKLRLNRAELVAYRLERRLTETARHVQFTLLQRLTQLEHQVQALTARVERLGGGDPPSV